MEQSERIRIQKGVFTICFVLMSIINQILGSAEGRPQLVAKNCLGILMAVIILAVYDYRDFLKLPYYIWSGVFVIGYAVSLVYASENYLYFWRWAVAGLNVGLYGLIVLRLIIKIFYERGRLNMRWTAFSRWIAMMFFMVIFSHDRVWPVWFFVMFGCFYLTEYSKEERAALFDGMMNGIIISFFIIQGLATLYRCYDQVRYTGLFTNSNMNALFYLVVQIAILGKWYKFAKEGAGLFWKILALFGSGVMITYCFLTIGRLAFVMMLINVPLMGLFVWKAYGRRQIGRCLAGVFAAIAIAFLSFPVVFFSIRMIPAYMFSPMRLAGDTPDKIQGWTPLDDPRYVEMDEFLKESIGRFSTLFVTSDTITVLQGQEPVLLISGQGQQPSGALSRGILLTGSKMSLFELLEYIRLDERTGDTPENAFLPDEGSVSSMTFRGLIYMDYLSKLNLTGHSTEENTGVWLTPEYHAPHAHNVFLQMAFEAGIIGGILFLINAVSVLFFLGRRSIKIRDTDWTYVLNFLLVLNFLFFGCFELDWNVGSLTFTLFFIAQYQVMHKSDRKRTGYGRRTASL